MVSSIVLLVFVATVCMWQTVDAFCLPNVLPCFADAQCCSNACFNSTCCQSAGSCTKDLECCYYYTGVGGCNANKICGVCVPENGACTTTADCCIGITNAGLTCANNICAPVLYNAYQNALLIFSNSLFIFGPSNSLTILKLFVSYIKAFAPNLETPPYYITVGEVAALGNINRNDIINAFRASAAKGLLPDFARTIDNITVGQVCNYFEDLITVANSQPSLTFINIPFLDTNLITGVANIKISDFANIVQGFIDDIAITGSDTITEVADTIGGDITINDLAILAGIDDIAHVGDLTLDKIATAADLFADLAIATINDDVCDADSDCCSGSDCRCCRPVRSGIKFCGTCPCVENGTCRHGSDCCSGRCCDGECCDAECCDGECCDGECCNPGD